MWRGGVESLNKCTHTLSFTGICLFLYKRYSLVDKYDCHGFTHGCPNTSHFSDEIYKCKYILYVSKEGFKVAHTSRFILLRLYIARWQFNVLLNIISFNWLEWISS